MPETKPGSILKKKMKKTFLKYCQIVLKRKPFLKVWQNSEFFFTLSKSEFLQLVSWEITKPLLWNGLSIRKKNCHGYLWQMWFTRFVFLLNKTFLLGKGLYINNVSVKRGGGRVSQILTLANKERLIILLCCILVYSMSKLVKSDIFLWTKF